LLRVVVAVAGVARLPRSFLAWPTARATTESGAAAAASGAEAAAPTTPW